MQEQTIFELIYNMDTYTNQLIVEWNKVFNEDLGVSHLLVLGHLREHGKSRPSDIAKRLGLTPPTLSYLSEKLVKRKFAVRKLDMSDRRIVYLEITNAGEKVLAKAEIEGQQLRRALFAKLTEEDREHLTRIYKKMNTVE